MPAPRAAAFTPMISGMMNAALNTGPMKPTDCASTSISESFLPPRRSYSSVTTNGRSPSTDPSPPDERICWCFLPRRAYAVQPPSGCSNHTCTWPVPTEASYSLNSSPVAVQSLPPRAAAIIR